MNERAGKRERERERVRVYVWTGRGADSYIRFVR